MTTLNDFIYAHQFMPKPVHAPEQQKVLGVLGPTLGRTFEKPREKVDLEWIIENRPKASIVRDFFRANLGAIQSEEDRLFKKE